MRETAVARGHQPPPPVSDSLVLLLRSLQHLLYVRTQRILQEMLGSAVEETLLPGPRTEGKLGNVTKGGAQRADCTDTGEHSQALAQSSWIQPFCLFYSIFRQFLLLHILIVFNTYVHIYI